MVARVGGFLLVLLLCTRALPASNSPSTDAAGPPIPALAGGVDIEGIHGWFANIYPWKYMPNLSTVYPVRSLLVRLSRIACEGIHATRCAAPWNL